LPPAASILKIRPMPDRIFTEEEVKAIIRRASARQEEEAERHEAREHGLTLADLEQLGAEVGLDPRHLRAAADEVRTGHRTAVEAETETATHVIVEHWIDRPFTLEAWEDTVGLLRSQFGVDMGMWYGRSGDGRVERVGRAHEWVHVSQLGVETRVSASEREGRTRLLLSQRVGYASPKVEGYGYGALVGLGAGLLGGGVAAGMLSGGAGVPFLVFLALMLATTLGAGPLITRMDRGWRQKKRRGLKALAADIDATFEAVVPTELEAVEPSPEAPELGPEAAGLDLDALPDAPVERDEPPRNRTRSGAGGA
jgi:hypothetical protein